MPRKAKPRAPAPNRVDLGAPVPAQDAQPVRVPTGLPYGQHQQLERAQRAVPVAQAPGTPVPTGDPIAAATAMAPPPEGGLFRPTERPAEPISDGAPFGPGRQPPIVAPMDDDLMIRARLAAAYRLMPTRELANVIAAFDAGMT